jgi:hypothetical protein
MHDGSAKSKYIIARAYSFSLLSSVSMQSSSEHNNSSPLEALNISYTLHQLLCSIEQCMLRMVMPIVTISIISTIVCSNSLTLCGWNNAACSCPTMDLSATNKPCPCDACSRSSLNHSVARSSSQAVVYDSSSKTSQ